MSEVCEAKALQRIVVATDLTPAAAMATSRAAQLAADTGARLERDGVEADLVVLNAAYRVYSRLGIPVLVVSRPVHGSYSRMLLAVDLSPASARAGRVAQRLFPDAELHLLHACESPYEGLMRLADVEPGVVEDYRRRALHEARRQLDRFAREAGLEDAVREVRYGHPAAWIRRRALELGADLVVLRPAQSWLARGMASSVTEQVLNDPPCDALLVG